MHFTCSYKKQTGHFVGTNACLHTPTHPIPCHRTSQPCRVHSHANTISPFIQCDPLWALPRYCVRHTRAYTTPVLTSSLKAHFLDLVPAYLTLHHTQPGNTSSVLTTPSLLSVAPSPPSQLAFTWTATLNRRLSELAKSSLSRPTSISVSTDRLTTGAQEPQDRSKGLSETACHSRLVSCGKCSPELERTHWKPKGPQWYPAAEFSGSCSRGS